MAWVKVQPAVFSFLRSQITGYHDAEDALQRVAAAVIQKRGQYDPAQPFIAWAIGFARIEVMRYRATAGRDKLIFSEKVVELVADSYCAQSDHLREMGQAMEYCIKKLPDRQRKILNLHYMRSEPGADIAEQLGMTANAVFVTLHRVRTLLRRCINAQMQESQR